VPAIEWIEVLNPTRTGRYTGCGSSRPIPSACAWGATDSDGRRTWPQVALSWTITPFQKAGKLLLNRLEISQVL
jgi:hypothetical protein